MRAEAVPGAEATARGARWGNGQRPCGRRALAGSRAGPPEARPEPRWLRGSVVPGALIGPRAQAEGPPGCGLWGDGVVSEGKSGTDPAAARSRLWKLLGEAGPSQ